MTGNIAVVVVRYSVKCKCAHIKGNPNRTGRGRDRTWRDELATIFYTFLLWPGRRRFRKNTIRKIASAVFALSRPRTYVPNVRIDVGRPLFLMGPESYDPENGGEDVTRPGAISKKPDELQPEHVPACRRSARKCTANNRLISSEPPSKKKFKMPWQKSIFNRLVCAHPTRRHGFSTFRVGRNKFVKSDWGGERVIIVYNIFCRNW